jgi:hypothetical protein
MRDVLALVLAPERSPEERLASLTDLEDHLQDEDTVLALAAAARTERSVPVRAGMLGVLVAVDLTRLVRRDELVDALMAFSALEPEPELRLAATRRLAELAPSNPAIPDLLAENLLYDLSVDVERACVAGIAACPRWERSVIDRVIAAAGVVRPPVRYDLRQLYERLERADLEAGMLALLDPLEEEALRRGVLDALGRLPWLSASAVEPLVTHLAVEPIPELRALAVQVLSGGVRAAPGLLDAVLDAVRRHPEDARLLHAFWRRVASVPGAVERLEALFHGAGSTAVKLNVLELLAETAAISLFTAALGDPSSWVRGEAIGLCARHGRAHAAVVGRALAERIPEEPVPSLRVAMIEALGTLGALDPATGQSLLGWLPRETSPGARVALARVLPGVAITGANRRDILRAFLEVLTDPLVDDEVRAAVRDRLAAFEHRDEPELAECVMALMDRSGDLVEVGRLYDRLRTLRPDPASLLRLERRLLYRFVGHYPQAPLDTWVRDLAGTADPELRAEVPHLIRVTGATWLLDAAEPAAQRAAVLPAILGALRGGRRDEAARLLDDAYERRTLRRSDAVALLRELLSYPGGHPLLTPLLRILREVGIVSAGLVDRCLDWLCRFPAAPGARDVEGYLREMGPREPTWTERLDAAFSAEQYRRHIWAYLSVDRRYPARPVWGEPWRPPAEVVAWPVAELFFAHASPEQVASRLETPVQGGGLPHHAFHYLLLARLNLRLNDGGTLATPELLAIGHLLRATAASPDLDTLHDRALFVLDRAWPSFSTAHPEEAGEPELNALATEVTAEVSQRRPA